MLNQCLPDNPNLTLKREYDEEYGKIPEVDIDKYQVEPSKIAFMQNSINNNIEVDESQLAFVEYSATDPKVETDMDCKVGIEDTMKIEFDIFQAEYKKVNEENFVGTNTKEADHKINIGHIYPGIDFEMKNEVESDEVTVKVKTDCYEEEYNDVLHEPLIEQKKNDILNSNIIPSECEDEMDFKLEIEENIKIEFDSHQEESEETSLEKLKELDENVGGLAVDGINGTQNKHKKIAEHHQEIQEKRSMFVCSMCGKEVSRADQLRLHMFSHLKEALNIRELDPLEICDKLGVKIRIKAELKGKEYNWQTFKCVQCNYSSLYSYKFHRHIEAKHQSKTSEMFKDTSTPKADLQNSRKFLKDYTCPECNFKCYKKRELKIHIELSHDKIMKFKCNFSSELKGDLRGHMSSVHLKECHLCDYKAKYKSHLEKHMSSVHLNERKFECHLCEYKGKQKVHLDIHISSVHMKERKFECKICPYRAHQKSSIRKHMSVHVKKCKFDCHLCEYKTDYKSDLDMHLCYIHLKKRKFECNLCEYKTNKKSTLNIHISSVHLKERIFKCEFCEYRTNKKSTINDHISCVHIKELKFECGLCPYKANLKANLEMHMSCVHLKERKYECHLCPYKANRKSTLDIHLFSSHMKEFECQLCEYKANRKSTLKEHVDSVHLKERGFECHLCEYKTNIKSNLNSHLNSVHLNERNFECQDCEYKANNKSSLNRHMSSVHLNERKFKCHLCEYKANSKSNLVTHLRSIHIQKGAKC